MATDYPGAIDSTKLTNPATTDKRNSPSLAGAQANQNDAIKAVETKVGIGATTPAANQLLFGTGAGTSAWQALTSAQLLAILSDETGTGAAVFANTPTLITPKVDTINENTLNNGVTVGGVNLKSGALNTNNSVVTTNITNNAVDNTKVAAGFCVQMVQTTTSAVATGTTIVPFDNTIPQNTEGDQYMSLAITPKSTTNILIIQATILVSSSVPKYIQAALFQDTTANALAVNASYPATTNSAPANIVVTHSMVAGTTSATTFKVRIGPDGAATITFNGTGGTQLYSTAVKSSIVITEYKA